MQLPLADQRELYLMQHAVGVACLVEALQRGPAEIQQQRTMCHACSTCQKDLAGCMAPIMVHL